MGGKGSGGRIKDLTGKKYGYLTVLQFNGLRKKSSGYNVSTWLCECKEGNKVIVDGDKLTSGNTKSCGCMLLDKLKTIHEKNICHNQTGSKLYQVWSTTKIKCFNKNYKDYKYFGAKGITMYLAWVESFEAFRDYMLSIKYVDGLVIKRIDEKGNFEPGNIFLDGGRKYLSETREKNRGKKAMEEVAG